METSWLFRQYASRQVVSSKPVRAQTKSSRNEAPWFNRGKWSKKFLFSKVKDKAQHPPQPAALLCWRYLGERTKAKSHHLWCEIEFSVLRTSWAQTIGRLIRLILSRWPFQGRFASYVLMIDDCTKPTYWIRKCCVCLSVTRTCGSEGAVRESFLICGRNDPSFWRSLRCHWESEYMCVWVCWRLMEVLYVHTYVDFVALKTVSEQFLVWWKKFPAMS